MGWAELIKQMATTTRAAVGVAITYYRGESTLPLTASVGKTDFEVDDGNGVFVSDQARDYLVDPAALVLTVDGVTSTFEPRRGDRISEIIAGKATLYEVQSPGKEPVVSWDPQKQQMRIHTKFLRAE